MMGMSDPEFQTATDTNLPWDGASRWDFTEALHLTLTWSLHEPHRVGETTAIAGECVLGRGGPQSSDHGIRLLFAPSRPQLNPSGRPLESSRISRTQLLIDPIAPTRARVRNVGRGTLQHNGVFTGQTVIQPGDVLTLHNSAVFLVELRPTRLLSARAEPADQRFHFGRADTYGMVGESAAMWRLRDDLIFAATSDRHVLLLGESGVGKELAARAIHALSKRASHPLISRNAATFPATLIDAELFGNAKNYPNVGTPERVGLIGEADGSHLFLDEIGELPAEQQTHLLRVVDRDGEYQRLGESRSRQSDMRLLAATNRSIESLKEDLCARFPVRLTVPSLDERRADIPHLVVRLMDEARQGTPENCEQFFGPEGQVRTSPALVAALLRHTYRHNVRELERILWLSMSTSRGSFLDLTEEVTQELQRSKSIRVARPKAEEQDSVRPSPAEIAEALAQSGGSKTEAARRLGLKSRYALYRLLKK